MTNGGGGTGFRKRTRGSSFSLRWQQKIVPEGVRGLRQHTMAELSKLETKGLHALVRVALAIRRDMDQTSPLIPLDTGNLRSSFFIVTSRGTIPKGMAPEFSDKNDDKDNLQRSHNWNLVHGCGKAKESAERGPVVVIGFGAYYAGIVHEWIGAHPKSGRPVNWSRPGSGPKWLEAAMKRMEPKFDALIAQYMK